MTSPNPDPIPSPRISRLFWQRIKEEMANEGEPAALGKTSSGPVYYDDGTTVHRNRVWFRKGANLEVVGIARADNMGLPDVPDLQIRVVERFNIHWVVDYDRNDDEAQPYKVVVSANDTTPDHLINKLVEGSNVTITEQNDGGNETLEIAASGGGGGGASGVHTFHGTEISPFSGDGWDTSYPNPTFDIGWVFWEGETTTLAVFVGFIAEKTSETVTLKLRWYSNSFSTNNIYFRATFSSTAIGSGYADNEESVLQIEAELGWNIVNESEITLDFSDAAEHFDEGDYVQIWIDRLGGHANDTGDGGIVLLHVTAVENDDG